MKILNSLLILLISMSASAELYENENIGLIKFDGQECKTNSSVGKTSCLLTKNDVKVKVSCRKGVVLHQSKSSKSHIYCPEGKTMIIESNFPIAAIGARSDYQLTEKNELSAVDSINYKETLVLNFIKPMYELKIVHKQSGYFPHFQEIYVDSKSMSAYANTMNKINEHGKKVYLKALKATLESMNEFREGIALSHQNHLTRYEAALKNFIAIVDHRDKFSYRGWRIQECSRRVYIFGIVLNELINDYSHVQYLFRYIENIQALNVIIKNDYEWERGLSGNVSKATGALLEIISFEIREILSIKIATGASNFDNYIAISSEIDKLISKVNASRSGDMVIQRNIWDFTDVWNGDAWQEELEALINAPSDTKNLIMSKLQLLLMSVESLNDLTKAGFKTPIIE